MDQGSQKMCIHTMNLVRHLPTELLTRAEYVVLNELANYREGKIFPSYNEIAKKTHYSRMTVIRTINKLEENDYIEVKKVQSKKRGHCSNNYTLNLTKIKEQSTYKPVEKSVNKPVENTPPSNTVLPEKVTPCYYPSNTVLPYTINDHNHRSLKDHNDWKQPNDHYLKAEVTNILIKLRVCEKDIPIWVRDYGVQKIFSKLSEMKQIQMSRKIAIHNPGAYLRTLLEETYKVA